MESLNLTSPGGIADTLNHRIQYVARLTNPTNSIIGNSWLVQTLPYLVFGTVTIGGFPARVSRVTSQRRTSRFERVGSVYKGRSGTRQSLAVVGTDYVVTMLDGSKETFHGTSAVAGLRGKLKRVLSADGIESIASYDGSFRMVSLSRSLPGSGNSASLIYSYASSGLHTGRLVSVEKRISRNGVEKPVKRWVYTHHSGLDSAGSLNDLKTGATEVFNEQTGVWERLATSYYRYYKGVTSTGFAHGLKYVVAGEDYARMVAAGLPPEDVTQVTDAILANYCTNFREYDVPQKRIAKMVKSGGAFVQTFARLNGAANWARRTVETQPDGSVVTSYYTSLNQIILRVLQMGAESWPTYYEYDVDQNKVLEAGPDAIASFDLPSTPSDQLDVTLKDTEGLVLGWEYFPLSGSGGAGSAPGFLKRAWLKQGKLGTQVKLEDRTYTSFTANGTTVYRPATVIEYRSDAGGGSVPATTSYAWQWQTGRLIPLQKTTNLPVVAVTENGTGVAAVTTERYDVLGNVIWTRDQIGVLGYAVWDALTGAVLRQIEDVDTLRMDPAVVPSGWSTPAGGGLHLITDYQSDAQGRWTLELGPEHPLEVRGEIKMARQARYRVYLDGRHQTWNASGYAVGDGFRTLGAARITQKDISGRVTDEVSVSVPEDDRIDSADSMPQSRWTRWTRKFYNQAGLRIAERSYVQIPVSDREVDGNPVEGFPGTDYLQVNYAYDSMERVNRVVTAGGTIRRLEYNARGLTTEQWVGTNDTGATNTDPTGGGAAGNDMRQVEVNIWDNGRAGQSGSLTKVTRPVNATTADNLVTDYDYDFRGRRIRTSTHDGTQLLIEVHAWDNWNLMTSVTRYKNTVTAANRMALSEMAYDAWGRVWRSTNYGVNANGTLVSPALTADNWYDPRGLRIKSTQPERGGVYEKMQYDTIGRAIVTYLAYPQTGDLSGNSNSVVADIVLEQTENLWDNASNNTQVTQRQRFENATGPGALKGPATSQPQARVTYQASWHDGIGRVRVNADYGTNGGAMFTRPALAPEASDTVLVTRTAFAGDGEANQIVAADGTISRWENDRLGRVIKNIDNADSPAARTTQYSYAPDGGLDRLIISNPETGDQVTTWQYGTTIATDGVARTDLLKAKVYPLDVNAVGQVARQTTYTYDRQGRATGSKDPNGTEHAYVLDKLSRITQDSVTALGTGIDGAVRRIALEFTDRGLLSKVTSHNNATVGSGAIVNQVALSYNAFNQLAEDAQSHTGAVTGTTPKVGYSYANGAGNTTRRLTVTYPSLKVVSMSYGSTNSADDRLSRLAAVTAQGEAQPLGQFAWMGAGRLVSLTMPQPGIALSYKQAAGEPVGDSGDPYSGYDRFGRTVDMRWIKTSDSSSLSRIQYGYDRMSRRLWRQDLAAPATTKQDRFYGYDGLGQVVDSALGNLNINRTAIAGIPAQREAFDYDSIGNWKDYLRQSDGLTTLNQERTHNKDNQLIELNANASGLSYDANGNMTACRPDKDGDWSKGYTMVWDAWNRLVLVRNSQTSATVAGYAYDGLTRRITTTIGSTVRRFFYNDAWKCVEERLNTSSNPDRLYYWSSRTGHRDELLRRDRATSGSALNETLWCLMDYFDPIAVANAAGVIQERYSYSAFGLAGFLTPGFTARPATNFAWNFLFHGQFRDSETGWDNYGFRYYLPWLGSWPSRDPIGEVGGLNLYSMAGNTPANEVDFYGLWSCKTKCEQQASQMRGQRGAAQECRAWKRKNCKCEDQDDDGGGGSSWCRDSYGLAACSLDTLIDYGLGFIPGVGLVQGLTGVEFNLFQENWGELDGVSASGVVETLDLGFEWQFDQLGGQDQLDHYNQLGSGRLGQNSNALRRTLSDLRLAGRTLGHIGNLLGILDAAFKLKDCYDRYCR